MEHVKVSIIIPVYNAEAYLDNCLAGVIGQSYRNLEIIIIDDGSSDSSLSICRAYGARDKRIQIIQKKQEGVSKARNIGIHKSSGKYLLFVDADDEIDKAYAEKLTRQMVNKDIAVCAYTRCGKEKKSVIFQKNGAISREELFLHTFCSNLIGGACWNKIFSADLIKRNHLQFDENIFIGEDMLFLAEYYLVCKSAGYIGETLYTYHCNADSAMQQAYRNGSFAKKGATCLKAANKLNELYAGDNRAIMDCIAYRNVRTSLWLLYQMIYCGYYDKDLLFRIQCSIRPHYVRYQKNSYASFLEKMTAAGMCLFPEMVYRIARAAIAGRKERFQNYLS